MKPKNPRPQAKFLKTAQVAALFGVSRLTVINWGQKNPDFPRPYQLMSNTSPFLWAEAEINLYLKKHKIQAVRPSEAHLL